MSDLAEFLLARIAEDEARQNAPVRMRSEHLGTTVASGPEGNTYVVDGRHLTRSQFESEYLEPNPDCRVLAECAAKRRIVEECSPSALQDYDESASALAEATLRALASVYADHPDYREEWKP